MVSQLGPDFLGHITTGGHGPFAVRNLHSTPTNQSWPRGRRNASHASGGKWWTSALISDPSPRVKWSPSRMLRITGLGRRTDLTSIPCPSRNPGPCSSGQISGSTTPARLLLWGGAGTQPTAGR